MDPVIYIFAFVLIVIVSFASNVHELGYFRSVLAMCCRFVWLSPIFMVFFPVKKTLRTDSYFKDQQISVLVDDSTSMQSPERSSEVKDSLKQIHSDCVDLGCQVKVTYLSKMSADVGLGFSPLKDVIPEWYLQVKNNPWLVITDASDSNPKLTWDRVFKTRLAEPSASLDKSISLSSSGGAIAYFKDYEKENIYISNVDFPRFAFFGKSAYGRLSFERQSKSLKSTVIQVQIVDGDDVLQSHNVEFFAGASESYLDINLAELKKGRHLLNFRILPTPEDQTLWDNNKTHVLEVMNDTVGILHLLGSPSWDGRFMRRFLKSEPKYDVISFFILRDPWDSQNVSEKEISLIPFPVHKLFTRELSKFKVIVLQNFNLVRFLRPEYQRNIVKFVKEGGGLFFIGGPKAFTYEDIVTGPLAEILPFQGVDTFNKAQTDPSSFLHKKYLGKEPLNLSMQKVDEVFLPFVSFYDRWLRLSGSLLAWNDGAGVYPVYDKQLKKGNYVPLVNTSLSGGQQVPLAIASYPQKGRAIWLLSDNMWKFAFSKNKSISRMDYNNFMQAAMVWLLRSEISPPLLVTDFELVVKDKDTVVWHALVEGDAAGYLEDTNARWNIEVCGKSLRAGEYDFKTSGNYYGKVSGVIAKDFLTESMCTIELSGHGKQFGSLKSSFVARLAKIYPDSKLALSSESSAKSLASLLGARSYEINSSWSNNLSEWLLTQTSQKNRHTATQIQASDHYYWILDSYWFLLFLLFLPLEVLIRRWYMIFRQTSLR